ncbi:MAG: chemotaxis-specific protein-glutamate methyltransferase CheB [Acetobacteraceae bacterium]|nr:MAG: chemotaxis-specific protein-glutamate methyltransferase CheB [Acetobacteraceae bacterium]
MIKLLVVDDSALMRRLLANVFAGEGDFTLAFAKDGLEALACLAEFRPDVITLDIHMPRMDGLACLDRIMLERPCPVVMVSAMTEAGANVTLEAMQLGAVDFIAKPDGAISLAIDELGPLLVRKVRAAARARLRRSLRLADRVRHAIAPVRGALPADPRVAEPRLADSRLADPMPAPRPQPAAPPDGVVLVGTSTGGPPALDALLSPLPADFPWPILVAQHMPAVFTGPLARRLDRLCALTVQEVTRPVPLLPGHVYIGRGDADIVVAMRPGGPVVQAAPSLPNYPWHPSVDRLVTSALQHLGAPRLIGVMMTGMGHDGAAAMTRLRAEGGRTIAEAEETAVVWGMPGELVRAGGAEAIVPLDSIAGTLLGWLP